MGRHGIPRLVFASSMVVYGEGAYDCAAHGRVRPVPRHPGDLAAGRFEPRCPACAQPLSTAAVTEDAPLDPRNAYAASKVAQEHLAASWARLTGGAAVGLRYHNVYGPRMPRDTPYSGVAAIFRSWLESGEPPRVFEDGGQRRDFVHVRDVARANLLALQAVEPGGRRHRSRRRPAPGGCAATTSRAASPTQSARWRRRWPRPSMAGTGRWSPASTVSATSGTSWPPPPPPPADLGFRAQTGFAEGMAEFAHAPLREAASLAAARA